jgi:BNR repeat protein
MRPSLAPGEVPRGSGARGYSLVVPGRKPILAAVAAAALLLAGPAGAHRLDVSHLQPISGKTPFRGGCGVPGDEQPNAEAEPYLAASPRDPDRLVATFQQDRFDVFGGALSNLVATSRNGGRSWRRGIQLPGLSRCTGGQDERASDPWVSIGAEGTTYLASLTFDYLRIPAETGLAGPTAQHVSRSTDGGYEFDRPVTVVDQGIYDDRRLGLLGEQGPELFSRTTDGGRTWTRPRAIHNPGAGKLDDPVSISVLPDGTLLNTIMVANGTPVAFGRGGPTVPWDVMTQRSTDLGRTWSRPAKVATIGKPFAPEDPETGAEVRAFPVAYSDVAPDGTAYVAWNEIVSERSSRILFARSIDGGESWSDPGVVVSVPTQAFVPSIAVARDGTVGVSWDDFRRDRKGDGKLLTDVWFAHSHDGGDTWSESHLAGPFDMLTAPTTESTEVAGRFVGDYQALVGLRRGFGAVFAQARPQAGHGPSDIFFARLQSRSPSPRRGRLRVRIRGVPRRCASRSFRARVRAGRLDPGRHRLSAVARDSEGHRAVRRKRFRRC